MANTYYDSQLTAAEIEQVLEAISGILTSANNGKVLAISDGTIEARSVQWGGAGVVLEPLNVTENGDYTPGVDVDGFSEVHVSVPNSYSASDEGKVVSNGALVAQTARESQLTQNGTYDTTLNDEVTVNVSGGGSAVVHPLSATQNGTYNPPSGVDGYAPVTVNVSGGGGSDPALPNEYQKVEYLSVTGTQYVTVQSGLGSVGVMTIIDVSQDVISTSESGFAGHYYSVSNVTELYIKNSAYAYTKSPSLDVAISENLSANTRYSIRFVWPRALGAYFNIGQYRPGYYSFTGKIYRAEFIPQFSNNATALLIPCYRKSDLEPGFYDVINNIFYTNVGTGTFGVGPDVN